MRVLRGLTIITVMLTGTMGSVSPSRLRIRGCLTLPYPLWPIERGVASAYEVKSCCFS